MNSAPDQATHAQVLLPKAEVFTGERYEHLTVGDLVSERGGAGER